MGDAKPHPHVRNVRFEELVLVDLPSDARHELYRDGGSNERVMTAQGGVTYRYHSMTDLTGYSTSTFDLVYIGQAIEHVSISQADDVLAQVHRILRPSGYLALDTPNSKVTRLQHDRYIDPDHKYEYSHAEMASKLSARQFRIIEGKGLNYAGNSVRSGAFDVGEVANSIGMFADLENCYLLCYVCQPDQ